MNTLYENIYSIVKEIPLGKVSTYAQIAFLSGNPRRSRVVGFAMASCKHANVPCHRVIYSSGELSKNFGIGGTDEQRLLLENEGIEVSGQNTVDLNKFLWKMEE